MNRSGVRLQPFEFLDSTKDSHLYDYLITPSSVDITWGDTPIMIFASPGGGKSALRIYAEKIHRDSRGVKFPVTYIPTIYNVDEDFHFKGLLSSLAKSLFIYLISYPDFFLALPIGVQKQIRTVLDHLPYEVDYILSLLIPNQSVVELEQIFGVHALSGIKNLGSAHQQLAAKIDEIQSQPKSTDVFNSFVAVKNALGAKSIHIMIDGLDGFLETTKDAGNLINWINPMLNIVEEWQSQGIYLKFFLPIDISEFRELKNIPSIQFTSLNWDDELLAKLIRRRVYVATDGAFGSLDAICTPDIQDVELHLAHQLSEKNKLPRQMIIKSRELITRAEMHNDGLIHYADLFHGEE